MSEPTVEYATEVATLPHPETSTSALVLDSVAFDKIMAVADVMAGGKSTVPKHLQGNSADCMAVIIQAMQWKMNPFVVAQKTHLVNGALGYEAQLVNAVVCASGAIVGGFHYEYGGAWETIAGQGDNRKEHGLFVRVGAKLAGNEEITWGEPLYLIDVKTRNSPLWKTNPKQQLGYLGVKNWTRLYAPGPLLGVYSVDELQDSPQRERDITPRKTATEFAQAASRPPAALNQDQVDNKISDLEIVAREQGEGPFKTAWNGLTAEMRKAIGVAERGRLLAMATAIDAEMKETIDADGVVEKTNATGGDDDNPFAGA